MKTNIYKYSMLTLALMTTCIISTSITNGLEFDSYSSSTTETDGLSKYKTILGETLVKKADQFLLKVSNLKDSTKYRNNKADYLLLLDKVSSKLLEAKQNSNNEKLGALVDYIRINIIKIKNSINMDDDFDSLLDGIDLNNGSSSGGGGGGSSSGGGYNGDTSNTTTTKIDFDFQDENYKYKVMSSGCEDTTDNPDCSGQDFMKKTPDDALVYCENLIYGGFDDWSLPKRNELGGMSKNRNLLAIDDYDTYIGINDNSSGNYYVVFGIRSGMFGATKGSKFKYNFRCIRKAGVNKVDTATMNISTSNVSNTPILPANPIIGKNVTNKSTNNTNNTSNLSGSIINSNITTSTNKTKAISQNKVYDCEVVNCYPPIIGMFTYQGLISGTLDGNSVGLQFEIYSDGEPSYYYLILPASNSKPTATEIVQNGTMGTSLSINAMGHYHGSFTIDGLTPLTNYKVYMVAKKPYSDFSPIVDISISTNSNGGNGECGDSHLTDTLDTPPVSTWLCRKGKAGIPYKGTDGNWNWTCGTVGTKTNTTYCQTKYKNVDNSDKHYTYKTSDNLIYNNAKCSDVTPTLAVRSCQGESFPITNNNGCIVAYGCKNQDGVKNYYEATTHKKFVYGLQVSNDIRSTEVVTYFTSMEYNAEIYYLLLKAGTLTPNAETIINIGARRNDVFSVHPNNKQENYGTIKLTELEPGTKYTLYVTGKVGGDKSVVQSVTFTTLSAQGDGVCGASNGVEPTNIAPTNLCIKGRSSLTSMNSRGQWTWTCTPTDGGKVTTCQTKEKSSTSFNSSIYLQNKTTQLNAIKYQNRSNWTTSETEKAIKNDKLTIEEHYNTYGKIEGVSATTVQSKEDFVKSNTTTKSSTTKSRTILTTSSGIQIDKDIYLQSKADQMNSIKWQNRTNWTASEAEQAIYSAGYTIETHYETYGKNEGIRIK